MCEDVKESDVRRQYPFHLLLPIITSEREKDRDTHRSLLMSNIHFELTKEVGRSCQRNEQL